MFMPIVFAAVISLLTTSPEKPLCCFATERGWIVYALGSPDLHILRPHSQKAFTPRIVLTSGKLTPSNLKNHKLSTLAVGNRLILEYDHDFLGGFPSNSTRGRRCRGECSTKGLFDGKVIDQKGQPSTLYTRTVDQGDPFTALGKVVNVNNMIAGDMFENSEKEILSIKCYEIADRSRILGWFKCGDVKSAESPVEIYNVACPFKGHFKFFHVNER